MTQEVQAIIIEVIKVFPSVLLYLILGILLFKLYRPFKEQLLPKLANFKAFGIEVGFIKEKLQAATKNYGIKFNDEKGKALLRRLQNYDRTRKAHVLWIDDDLKAGRNERRILNDMGITCYQVTNSDEALKEIQNESYDLIVSDIYRQDNPSEGVDFLEQLVAKKISFPPIIFSIANFQPEKGTPPFAFGITNQPVELFHLILDVLERKLD
ncbi:MAG: response regulator [Bacteroidota bacterium]